MTSALRTGTVLLLPVLAWAACDMQRQRPAMGEANSIIVVTTDSLWAQVQETALPALEPRVFTVRDEKAFTVEQVSPLDSVWLTFQQFRQILLLGPASDPWIAEHLDDAVRAELPAVVEREDVWARNQRVTVIALPAANPVAALASVLPRVTDRMRETFIEYAQARMYVSGPDLELQDTLEAAGAFTMLFPQVYTWERVGDAFVFRNHSELTGTVNRTFLVTSRAGVPDSLSVEQILAWRDTVAGSAYEPPQAAVRDRIESRRLEGWPGPALEAQGVWSTELTGGYPSAGPFISRAYVCPTQDRTYFVDAWLYAPSVAKPKFEYMIQLVTLLDTFRCGGSPRAAHPLAGA